MLPISVALHKGEQLLCHTKMRALELKLTAECLSAACLYMYLYGSSIVCILRLARKRYRQSKMNVAGLCQIQFQDC